MGGGLTITGEAIICSGDHILIELNRVFGNPNSKRYKHARANNHFGNVQNAPDNYNDLIDAYRQAGLVVPPGWERYLMLLGQADPQNIYEIAQFRYNGLTQGKGMSTITHDGGHVHKWPGSGDEPDVIDSPCPLSTTPT